MMTISSVVLLNLGMVGNTKLSPMTYHKRLVYCPTRWLKVTQRILQYRSPKKIALWMISTGVGQDLEIHPQKLQGTCYHQQALEFRLTYRILHKHYKIHLVYFSMNAQIDWSLIGQVMVHLVPNGRLIKKLQDLSLESLEMGNTMSRCYRRTLGASLFLEAGDLVAGVQDSVLDLQITILIDTGTGTTPIDAMGLQ